MSKKTNYSIIIYNFDKIIHKNVKTKVDAVKLIEKHFPYTRSCVKTITTKNKISCERLFRNISFDEPKEYWNNNIKVNVKITFEK